MPGIVAATGPAGNPLAPKIHSLLAEPAVCRAASQHLAVIDGRRGLHRRQCRDEPRWHGADSCRRSRQYACSSRDAPASYSVRDRPACSPLTTWLALRKALTAST
jgi:hypothetical protein